MKEPDWKVFKLIKAKAIQLFCDNALSEYQEIIENKGMDSHKAYGELYGKVIDRDKLMASLFDGHSRSKAFLQLLSIRREGLADEKLLKRLSVGFFQQTDSSSFN